MDPLLYKYATEGKAADFQKTLSDLTNKDSLAQDQFLLLQVSPQKNTFLHIAACYGHTDLAENILDLCPTLLTMKNAEDDTALHVAARAGNLDMVRLFLNKSPDIEYGYALFPTMRNKEGNTALHEALINHHQLVANWLIVIAPPVSFYINNEGKSALYLAAEAGYVRVVKQLIDNKNAVNNDHNGQGVKGKSPVYAAILGRNKDVLETILTMEPTIYEEDEGRTPLHWAVSTGYLEGVCLLLRICSSDSYVRDSNGAFPIHIASSKGYVDIMEELLKSRPDSIELLNNDGQNILHVAAKCGKDSVISYVMLKKRELQRLVNQKDKDGNTPLHLATLHSHPNVVSTLTWDKRTNLNLVNNKELTVLDIAEESYKDRVNTLSLMATLIVTVTFAAGFTMPGGYNNSNPNQGMATFLMKHMFHMFVICNAMAMYISILVAVILARTTLGDQSLAITGLRLAEPLLGLALTMMSLAFMAGIYLVVSGLHWLAIVVLVMGIVFVLFLVALLLLFFPSIVRYITYFPFRLIVWAGFWKLWQ